MKTAENNPATNVVPPGIDRKDILEAIGVSGYPLQSVVAAKLRHNFSVQEEWGFLDTDEGTVRSMDLVAEKFLWGPDPDKRVRPTLNLIVECKRSDLPYVFFLSDQRLWTPRFPLIAGLANDTVSVTTDDDPSSWLCDILQTLGLEKHSFLRDEPLFATTFTRCERQGSKLRLSGAEPYNALVHPLVKAIEHFRVVEAPPPTAVYFDLHFAIALAVLDAPMLGVPANPSADPLLVPWVRIPRHRGLEGVRSYEHRRNIYGLDVVHVGFFDEYLEKHLLPFADKFSSRALKHHIEIAEGQGFVSGMGNKRPDELEPFLMPRTVREAAKRVSAGVKRLGKKIRGAKSRP